MDSNQSLNPVTETKPSPTTPENKALIQIAGGYYDQQVWAVMKMMAQTFVDSKSFGDDVGTVAQAMVKLQAGREIGLMPIESLKYIAVVKGRPSLWGEKAIELVISAGHKVEWGKCDQETATVTITRKDNGLSMTNTFTMKQAVERGMHMGANGIKPAWKNSPENMLKFKAFHMTAKFLVPDALRGAGIAEIDDTETGGTALAVAAVTSSVNLESTAKTPGKLKPLAERMAEKVEKPAVVEDGKKAVIETKVVTDESAAVKPEEEPTYEPIKEPEVPAAKKPDIEKVLPVKKGETEAAKRMREAAEKARANAF